MSTFDYIAMALYFAGFFGYQYYFIKASYGGKQLTREAINHELRKKWLAIAMEKNEPMIAIQTIRNLIMTGTFLISLNMIMLGGFGSIISSNQEIVNSVLVFRNTGFATLAQELNNHSNLLKILISIFMLLYSALNFTSMIRILYNLNFTIPAAIYEKTKPEFQLEQVKRQSKHFNKGIRALLFSVGPVIWLLNTYIFIAFTIILTASFYLFDSKTNRT